MGIISSQPTDEVCYEPIEVITKQRSDELVYMVRGMHDKRPAWHFILIRYEKFFFLGRKSTDNLLKVDELGRNIEYRDAGGCIRQASGYGSTAPKNLRKWLYEQYDPFAVDQSISLVFRNDDIRLCTMKRTSLDHDFGFFLHYHRHEAFHYITLNEDDQYTLAFRSGLKSYDRIIEINGINIELDSVDEFKQRLDGIGTEFLRLLVCSPATHLHYKAIGSTINELLHSVQRPEPVEELDVEQSDQQSIGACKSPTSIELKSVQDPAESVQPKNNLVADCQQTTKQLHPSDPSPLPAVHTDRADAIHCQSCGTNRLRQDRYRCLECPKYDLCGMCFDQRCETQDHGANHAMIRFSGPDEIFDEPCTDIDRTVTLTAMKQKYGTQVHEGFQCQICKIVPIVGLRFKCDVCYDCHVCLKCMEEQAHHPSHTLLLMDRTNLPLIPVSDLSLTNELGRGGFATVYKAKWLSKNRIVACKVITIQPEIKYFKESFQKEIAAYRELSGPFFLRTYGYNIEKVEGGQDRCMLIMEFMQRNSLSRVLQEPEPLSLRLKLDMACQIASGMRKLHSHRMIHRDIRPDNILITYDYTAKIGDMGLARLWYPNANLTMVACPSYMPREFYTGKYDQSIDIYTFGLTLNELFTEIKHDYDLRTHAIKLKSTSPVFADLITRCLNEDPAKRPSAIEIESNLRRHKQSCDIFFKENNICFSKLSRPERDQLFMAIYNRTNTNFLKH